MTISYISKIERAFNTDAIAVTHGNGLMAVTETRFTDEAAQACLEACEKIAERLRMTEADIWYELEGLEGAEEFTPLPIVAKERTRLREQLDIIRASAEREIDGVIARAVIGDLVEGMDRMGETHA